MQQGLELVRSQAEAWRERLARMPGLRVAFGPVSGAWFRRQGFALVLAALSLVTSLRQRLAREAAFLRIAPVILAAASVAAFIAAVFVPEPEGEAAPFAAPAIAAPANPAPQRQAAMSPEAAGPPIALAPAPQTWQPVKRPIAVFHLEAPDLDRLAFALQVETRGRADRRDSLAWSVKEGETIAIVPVPATVIVERYEGAMPTTKPFFPDLAQRAAGAGLSIERISATGEIVTKFGAMEIADAILAAGTVRSACLAFRRSDSTGLTLAGWYCGQGRKPADRVGFVCFIDRLDLIGAGKDRDLKRLFAAAERNRAGCGHGKIGAGKTSWLDHAAPPPPLKLSQRPN